MGKYLAIAVFGLLLGCLPDRPAVEGSSLLVDMRPANRPALTGALDFELLDSGAGKACANRFSSTLYWVAVGDLAKLSNDALTQQAIAAAATDAITRLDNVDTILLTHVTTESKGPDRVCATIAGRGIRFIKANAPAAPATTPDPLPVRED